MAKKKGEVKLEGTAEILKAVAAGTLTLEDATKLLDLASKANGASTSKGPKKAKVGDKFSTECAVSDQKTKDGKRVKTFVGKDSNPWEIAGIITSPGKTFKRVKVTIEILEV